MNVSKDGFKKLYAISNLLEYKTLMCLLANASSDDGTCRITQTEIANQINTTRQAVNRSIQQLCSRNIISVEKVGLSIIYHFNPDYYMASSGYKELYKNFSKFKIKDKEDVTNE